MEDKIIKKVRDACKGLRLLKDTCLDIDELMREMDDISYSLDNAINDFEEDSAQIKQKPVVDEQKREMAEFIARNYIYISSVTDRYRCRGCQDRTSPLPIFKKDIKHKEGCIYIKSWLYLEELEKT